MFLTEKFTVPPFTPKPNTKPYEPFDYILIQRLNALLKSQPSNSISFLILSIHLLSSTISSFSTFLYDPNLSGSESDARSLSSHLNFSISLLDKINSLFNVIDQISLRRFHASLAIHLLSKKDLTPEIASKARASIAEWRKKLEPCPKSNLVRTRNLKKTAIGRALYAVEAVSELVTGLVKSSLGGSFDFENVRVCSDFCWADAFNGVLTAVKEVGKNGRVAEIEYLDVSLTELDAVVEDLSLTEKLTASLKKAETASGNLMEGLDGLRSAMNGLFRTAMSERNQVLSGFRSSLINCE